MYNINMTGENENLPLPDTPETVEEAVDRIFRAADIGVSAVFSIWLETIREEEGLDDE